MFSFLFFKKVITGFEDLHVLNEEAVFFLPFIYFLLIVSLEWLIN